MKLAVTRLASRVACLALAATLTAWASAAAQANAAALSADEVAKIEAAISSFLSAVRVPSMSVALVQDNQIRFLRSYGMADLENSVAAKPGTVYRIASVSKAVTAVAALQLAEKGRLDLDAPIQRKSPDKLPDQQLQPPEQ